MLSLGLTFAETTLYGNVDQAWNKVTKKSADKTLESITGLAPVQMGGGILGVKGSEELSSGLKASYTLEVQTAVDGRDAAELWNRQTFVGLSGGFGELRIGKQYSYAFMNTLNMDPGGATGLAGNNAYCVHLAHTKCSGGSDAPLRQSNGMQFDLPEMLSGLKVGATVVFGEANTANGGQATGDGNGISVSYTSGPFYAGYTFDKVKNTGVGLLTANDVSSAGTNKLTTMSASYDLGAAKISINNSKMSVDSKSLDNTFVAVSVPFGGNANIWASVGKGSAYRTSVSADKSHEGFQVGVNYALSKRTVLYAQYGQMEVESGLNSTAKYEQTGSAIGVHHSF